MSDAVTLYDILGVVPDASIDEIQGAHQDKAAQLAPDRISGAPSQVGAAADRALRILEQAQRVLCDPDGRRRYDEQAGISRQGTGLEAPEPIPAPGWEGGIPFTGEQLEAALGELLDLLAPQPRLRKRVVVPDVRGLFASVCFDVVPRAGLQLETVRMTEHPMPVDGLVVDQLPKPGVSAHRSSTLTVHVWHPSEGAR